MTSRSSYESRLADSYSEAASSLGSAGFTNLSGSDTFDTATGSSNGTPADSGNAKGTSDATSGFGGGLGGTGGRDASGALGGGGGGAFDGVFFNGTPLADSGGLLQSFDPGAAAASGIGIVAQPISAQTNTLSYLGPTDNARAVDTLQVFASPAGYERQSTDRAATFSSSPLAAAGGSSKISGVVAFGPKWTTVKLENGRVEHREGDRGSRNNNPGNLEFGNFAKRHGAVGTDGRFAVFPDKATGLKAQRSLLFGSDTYKNLTIAQAIEEYAPPNENDTAAYAAAVAKAAGVSTDTRLSDLTPAQRETLVAGSHRVEGNTGYKTTVISEADSSGRVSDDLDIALVQEGEFLHDIDRPGSAYIAAQAEAREGPASAVDIPDSAGMSDESIAVALAALNGALRSGTTPDATPAPAEPVEPASGAEAPRNPVEHLERTYLLPIGSLAPEVKPSGQEAIRKLINIDGNIKPGGVVDQLSPSTRVANAFEDYERTGRSGALVQVSPNARVANAFEDIERTGTPVAPVQVPPSAAHVRKVKTIPVTGEAAPAKTGNSVSSDTRASVDGETVPSSTTPPADSAEGITINPTARKAVETVVDIATGVNPISGALNLVSGLAGGPTAGKLAMKGFEWALNHPGEKELLERSARYDGAVNGNGDEPLSPVQTPTVGTPDETEEERLVTRYLNPVEDIWRPKPHERWGPDARRYR